MRKRNFVNPPQCCYALWKILLQQEVSAAPQSELLIDPFPLLSPEAGFGHSVKQGK